ncbi:putative ribonuclease H-like domain-containing protein [Tanacetum coccineum]
MKLSENQPEVPLDSFLLMVSDCLIMRNKLDIDEIDIDDLYNNLKVYEDELKRSLGSNFASQNLAFSLENTMDGDDLEELDLRWQVAMLTVSVLEVDSKGQEGIWTSRPTTCQTNDTNTIKTKLASESVVSNPKINRDSVIIEDWTLDDEEEVFGVQKVRPENQTVKTRDDKSGQNSHKQGVGFRKVKACFVCRALESKPVWDNTKRVNHPIFSKYPHLSETFATRPSINTDRHHVHATRPTYPRVQNMTAAGTRAAVNTGKGKLNTDLKRSKWVWRPKGTYLDHVSKDNGSFMLKKGNPEILLQDHAVVDSGCSSHMTSNKAYLSDYEDFNEGFVAFGSDPKGGKITGKGSSGKDKGPTQEYILLPLQPHRTRIPELAAKAMDDVSRQAFEEEKRRIASQKKAAQATSTNQLSTDRPICLYDRAIYASDTLPNDGMLMAAYDGLLKMWFKQEGKIQKASSALQAWLSIIHRQNRTNHKVIELFVCHVSLSEKPKTISQALQDESWVEAMQEELLQFKLQKVWVLVDLPYGKKVIGTKWVFRNKRDERSIVVKNKARLVAQGFRQEEGIDYDEVFAHVARIEAIRLFLAFASYMGFTVYQMDVKSIFLYGTIEEEVYVHQPLGFVDPAHPNKIYKVIKALYGLHQAPRAWYETLSSFLMENGFRRGTIDKTLFIKKKKSDIMLVQVYVDDIIFGSTKQSMCTEFEDCIHKRFQMSSMGELTFFLGLQVEQLPEGIFISQDKYVADILKKFDFLSIRTSTTPIKSNKPLVKDEDGVDIDVHVYRSMIGSLMYLTASRPYIMFDVCSCARFQVTPKASHLNAVKRIFRYLKHQPKLGLWYPRDSPFELEAYSDSDYGGASLDRKSTTGGCQFLRRRLISWQCKKQTIVANFTTEAEYVASANCLWRNPAAHSRTKHIEIRFHFIRDCYEKRLIEVIKIHTDHNVADLLTKGFDVTRSYDAPLLEGNTSGSAEDSVQLKELMKVKSLEKDLKRKSKKVIMSASEGEEPEDQGRIIQDIDDDPLVSLVRESMKEKSTDFVTPTKTSGEAQEEEEISPTILEAAKTSSKVASQSVSKQSSD